MDTCEHSGASLLPTTSIKDTRARPETGRTYPASALDPALKLAEQRAAEIERLANIIERHICDAMRDGWSFRAAATAIQEDREKRPTQTQAR